MQFRRPAVAGLLVDSALIVAGIAGGAPISATSLVAGGTAAVLGSAGIRPRLWRFGAAAFLVLCRGGLVATFSATPQAWALGAVFLAVALAAARRVRFEADGLCTAMLLGIVASVLLRLCFLGAPDLLPEEAYYWGYATHLSHGYLDHPPMVGWIIAGTTWLGGDHEAAVRIGALLCWALALPFVYGLSRRLHGATAGLAAMFLFALLPYFAAAGFVMTPDAPLLACWAAALFFFERSTRRPTLGSWLGVGVSIGVGMLSKYTIAALVPPFLVFALVDRRARRAWRTPGPYVAVLVALLIFSPVLEWNAQRGWASFLFQSVRRLREPIAGTPGTLLLGVLLLLTPAGILAVLRRWTAPRARADRLLALVTAVPLAAFVLFSLRHSTKLNWTGPIWIGALPWLAAAFVRASSAATNRPVRIAWQATPVVCAFGLALLLHHFAPGVPGVPVRARLRIPSGWREASLQVAELERRVEAEDGRRPVVLGGNRYFLASELMFYGADSGREIASQNLLGNDALMYALWAPPERFEGRIMIVASLDESGLRDERLRAHFASLGPVRAHELRRGGRDLGVLYTRVAYGYRPASTSAPMWARVDSSNATRS